MNKKILIFLLAFLLTASAVSATNNVLIATLDKGNYQPSGAINVSGTVYYLKSTSNNTMLNFSIPGNWSNLTSFLDGSFSKLINAPSSEGDYNLTIEAGDATVKLPFKVTQIDRIIVELMPSWDAYLAVNLTSDIGSLGITTDLNTTGGVVGANQTVDELNNKVYIIVRKDSSTGDFEEVFVEEDGPSVNESTADYAFLREGTTFTPGEEDYVTLSYVDPAGSEIVFVSRYPTSFSAEEQIGLIAVALDSNGEPINSSQITSLQYKIIRASDNALVDSGSLTRDPRFGGKGVYVMAINTSDTSGKYHIIIHEIGHLTYSVTKHDLMVKLETADGDPVFVVAPSEPLTLIAAAVDSDTAEPLTGGTITAQIRGPNVFQSVTMTNGSDNRWTGSYTPSATGDYRVIYTSNFSGETTTREIPFRVENYDIFLIPFGKNKGKSMGFAPNKTGYMIVAGEHTSNRRKLNLSTLTSNCSNITLRGIYNKNGENEWNGIQHQVTFTDFLSAQSDIPAFIQEEIKEHFGELACVVNFTTPVKTGIYKAKVDVEISGETMELGMMIGVQEIAAFGMPVTSEGHFNPSVSFGGNVTLLINVFDMMTGTVIDSSNITKANIVEVFSDEGLVTGDMLDQSLEIKSGMALLKFKANDSVGGFHFVRFMVEANVTRGAGHTVTSALGEGWFMERLYSIFAYPGGEGKFGSNGSISLEVEVYDASGNIGQEDVSITLMNVRYFGTDESIDVTDQGSTPTGTTNINGTCTLSFSREDQGLWDSGEYGVEVEARIVDNEGNELRDTGMGFFSVENFLFKVWPQEFEVSTQQDVTFNFRAGAFDESNANVTVTVKKLMSVGTFDYWHPPTEVANEAQINSSVTINNTNLSVTNIINMTGGLMTEEGGYIAILEANIGGTTQKTKVFFHARPFVLKVYTPGRDDPRYGMTETVTVKVKGFNDTITEAAHTLQFAWVDRVEREGQWDMVYKTKGQMETTNGMTSTCDTLGSCNLTFNLTGFEQGTYFLTMKANDSDNSNAQGHFHIMVEMVRITVPELMDWIHASETSKKTNATKLRIDENCNSDEVEQLPNGTTNCKLAREENLVKKRRFGDGWPEYQRMFFLMDINNETLYLINSTDDLDTNFSDSGITVGPLSAGDTFLDAEDSNWTITQIDTTSNYLYVESTDSIIIHENPSDTDSDSMLIKVPAGLSISGQYLQAESFRDEEWAKLDLDGDGDFDDDMYPILLADTTEAGIYDLVMMDDDNDFTDAINDTNPNGFSFGPESNVGGNTTYLLGRRYKSGGSGSTNIIQLTFTTNKPGWPGRDMGVFRPNSVFKVPIMVTNPGNTSLPLADVNVTIRSALQFGFHGVTAYTLLDADIKTTPSSGLVLIDVNTTGLEPGEYFLEVLVNGSDTNNEWIGTGDIWANPHISVRNFVVKGQIGLKGQIPGLKKWSSDQNNLKIFNSTMGFGRMAAPVMHEHDDLYHADTWELRAIWWNSSDGGKIWIDPTPDDWQLTTEDITKITTTHQGLYQRDLNQVAVIDSEHGTKQYINVSHLNIGDVILPYNISVGESYVYRGFNITLRSIVDDNMSANISVYAFCFRSYVDGIDTLHNTTHNTRAGPFNVMDIINGTHVQMNLTKWLITTQPAIQVQIQGEPRVRYMKYNDTYELMLYNSPQIQTSWDIEGDDFVVDTILLLNYITGQAYGQFGIGHPIPQLDNWAVVRAYIWDEEILMSNFTIDSMYPYPIWFTCDGTTTFYAGKFTENETKIKVDEGGGGPGREGMDFSTRPYYLFIWDDSCDGASEMTHTMLDNDVVFDPRLDGYDFNQTEEQSEGVEPGAETYREKWMDIGRENWPFTITDIDPRDPLDTKANLFSFKDWTEKGFNLTLWLTARDFDGKAANGTITIEKIKGITFSPDMPPTETEINLSTLDINQTTFTDGLAFMTLDIDEIAMGDYEIMFKVNATTINNQVEWMRMHLFIFDPEMMGGGP